MAMLTTPTPSDDVIDSRDVIEALRDLDVEGAEYAALRAFADDGESLVDWSYGVTLVRDSHFTEYARELAHDAGFVSGGEGWPLNCIDWERAAAELRCDYTPIEFDGVTYWGR